MVIDISALVFFADVSIFDQLHFEPASKRRGQGHFKLIPNFEGRPM